MYIYNFYKYLNFWNIEIKVLKKFHKNFCCYFFIGTQIYNFNVMLYLEV